jgi:hypothetical protein
MALEFVVKLTPLLDGSDSAFGDGKEGEGVHTLIAPPDEHCASKASV